MYLVYNLEKKNSKDKVQPVVVHKKKFLQDIQLSHMQMIVEFSLKKRDTCTSCCIKFDKIKTMALSCNNLFLAFLTAG